MHSRPGIDGQRDKYNYTITNLPYLVSRPGTNYKHSLLQKYSVATQFFQNRFPSSGQFKFHRCHKMGSKAFTEPSSLHEVGQQSDTAAQFPERYSNTSPDLSYAVSSGTASTQMFSSLLNSGRSCCPISTCWITGKQQSFHWFQSSRLGCRPQVVHRINE